MNSPVKLSSPATREFWEIPVLFEDEHLLALDKPAGLPISPEPEQPLQPERPNLTQLLHAGIADGKPWARDRNLTYLNVAHRLDAETSGVLLLAKSKPVFLALADLFGSDQPVRKYLVLVHGAPAEDRFEIDAKLAPHPLKPDLMQANFRDGKTAKTQFEVVEKFSRYTLMRALPLTDRLHQIRVHICHAKLHVVGDEQYGGKPLWLSKIKRGFRLKPGRTERALISRAAVHAEELTLTHPITGQPLTITAPWAKDLTVGVKYLRQFAKEGSEFSHLEND